MSDLRAVIYISEVLNPNLSLEFQEKCCRLKLSLMGYDNITVFKDVKDNRERFHKMVSEIGYYDILVIYGLINLGDGYQEIIDNTDKIFSHKKSKLYACIDPLNLTSLNEFFKNKAVFSAIITSTIYQNDFWKKYNEKFSTQNSENTI